MEKFAQACQDIANYLENRPVDLTDLDYANGDLEEVHEEYAE
jgi:hypothetical protein